MNVVTDRPRDCTSCRIVGGLGLIGIGAYLGFHSRKNPIPGGQAGKKLTMILAYGFVALGGARLLNLPPFKDFGSKTKTILQSKS